jgi:ferrous iron transport protein B
MAKTEQTIASTETTPACNSCTRCNTGQLTRLGVHIASWDFVVALAGNPNTGKSTLFNALTGLRQHVGNWPGKTVARAEGGLTFNEKRYKLIDLPGTYSLLSTSVDEEVARDFILFGRPDVTIVVTDATCLERNLGLALQVLEITDHAVIALNLMDEARRQGIEVDSRSLTRDLGVPVIPMAARRGEGIKELMSAVEEVALGIYPVRRHRIRHTDRALESALHSLGTQIETLFPGIPNAEWVALRLLEGDESIIRAVQDGTLGELTQDKRLPGVIPMEAK